MNLLRHCFIVLATCLAVHWYYRYSTLSLRIIYEGCIQPESEIPDYNTLHVKRELPIPDTGKCRRT